MGVLTLAATSGSEVLIQAEGDDEVDAAEAVEQLIRNRFGEEE
jgi:phosphocarrier protein